jgi:hypothetical protein
VKTDLFLFPSFQPEIFFHPLHQSSHPASRQDGRGINAR